MVPRPQRRRDDKEEEEEEEADVSGREANRSIEARRVIWLAALMVVAALMMMGVALLAAPDAEAKKKRKGPSYNVLQCPTENDGVRCEGTEANDYLKGGSEDREYGAYDQIFGEEGNDVYNGGNGSDNLFDDSTTSSDVYLFPSTEFSANSDLNSQPAEIYDSGGARDIVVLRSYSREDFDVRRSGDRRSGDNLELDGPGARDILIREFFVAEAEFEGEIEYFLFSDGLVTGDELASGTSSGG